jgi:transcriptional regulator with XRE-family HTH domain
MDTVNDRIKEIRLLFKLTQVDFSKRIYVSQGSIGEIETSVRPVNDRIIKLISTEFNINQNWLKTGKGDMFNVDKPDIGLDNLIKIYKQLDKPLQDYLIQQSENLLKLHNENTIKKRK